MGRDTPRGDLLIIVQGRGREKVIIIIIIIIIIISVYLSSC